MAGWVGLVAMVWLSGAYTAPARQLPALTVLAYFACWGGFFWISVHSRRENAARFALVTVSSCLALAALETVSLSGLYDFRPLLGIARQQWEYPENVPVRQLLHLRRPNLRMRGISKGGDLCHRANATPTTIREYDTRYDRNGFRNHTDYSGADCVVIGDSFVEAPNVYFHELLTTRIAETLGLTVANLGQSCYGPQQELIVLQRFGVPLRPRFCLWVFFEGNDLSDARRYEPLVEQWHDSGSAHFFSKERSFTGSAFKWLSSKLTPRRPKPDFSRSGVFRTDHGTTRLWFGYAGGELSDQDLAALDTTAASLGDAFALCQEQGIPLVVVYAPTKLRVYADVCQFGEDSAIRNWTANDLPQRLSERVSNVSKEIGFLDLTPEFQSAAKTGSLLYYEDDTHWSPDGHALAARVICEFLRRDHGHLLSG